MATASRKTVLRIVYFSVLLDNLLLTVVVPIVPDYLISVESPRKAATPWFLETNRSLLLSEEEISDENGEVGLLLSSKAVVQLVFNPLVGSVARLVGFTAPLFFGTINLLASSLLYALGESYIALFIARSLQGISSACIGVSGMCLVAEHYKEEKERSRAMGLVLGAVALGVLLGYPYGGFSYDFLGKMAPFLGIATFAIINIALQLMLLDLKGPITETPGRQEGSETETQSGGARWRRLLSDKQVMLVAGAIWLSSSAMALLEPCLPLWLISNIKPQKWEMGTVFIPDSIGYLVGTNCFGGIAYRFGRWRVAIASIVLVAVSAFMLHRIIVMALTVVGVAASSLLPMARTMKGLILPHACLGLGIGVTDAALVPLLACLVDSKPGQTDYASVYAIQQTSVSLAYALAPMVGGELVRVVGFPWLMRITGLLNLLYSPLLLHLADTHKQESHLVKDEPTVSYKSTEKVKNYNRFIESDESD